MTVTLQDALNSQLELVDVSVLSGACTPGQTVICTITVSSSSPALVTLQVRVRTTVAEGTVIPNQATLDQGGTQIAISNLVNVTVAGPPPPTVTNTPTNIPTNTPALTATPVDTPIPSTPTPVPTNTPVATVIPAPSPTPRPTSPPTPRPPAPRPPAPTEPPPTATAPLPPPALPTEPPPPAPVATVAPRPTATPRPRPPASPTPVPAASPTPTPTESPALAVFSESDLLLRLSSDWGSAYAGQDIVFTVVLGNTHPAQTIGAVSLRSVMPSNLQVLGANASRGADPTINGQTVTYISPDLAPGERVEVTIATRIRSNVAAGTLLVAQAQASYSGLSRPVFSNISTVLVVGAQPAMTGTATLAPMMSPTVTVTASPTVLPATATATASPAATATVSSGIAPTATVTATPPAAGGQSGGPAPLPETSAGIPLLGVLLLGATLLTRTIRLHRARERL